MIVRRFSRHSFPLLSVVLLALLAASSPGQSPDPFAPPSDAALQAMQAEIDAMGYTYTVGPTWVYDLSPEEKAAMFRVRWIPRVDARSARVSPQTLRMREPLPEQFDWRDRDGRSFVNPVRQQGECGSCYAFGAAAAAEGAYHRHYNLFDDQLIQFSEAFIAFCLSEMYPGFDGCDGANYDYDELLALCEVGIIEEQDYPYVDYPFQDCLPSAWDAPRVRFTDWYRAPSADVDAIKRAIMLHGVVDAAVLVEDHFMAYQSGIFENNDSVCEQGAYTVTNHAIALVGWNDNGDAERRGYWILRNSWGEGWGEGGYMRIRYGAARVDCAVSYLGAPQEHTLFANPARVRYEGLTSADQLFDPVEVSLHSTGAEATAIELAATATWFDVSIDEETVPAHGTVTFEVSPNVETERLGPGVYEERIEISDLDGELLFTIPVRLRLQDPFEVSPSVLIHEISAFHNLDLQLSGAFTVTNNTDETVEWTALALPDWVELGPESGELAGGDSATVRYLLDREAIETASQLEGEIGIFFDGREEALLLTLEVPIWRPQDSWQEVCQVVWAPQTTEVQLLEDGIYVPEPGPGFTLLVRNRGARAPLSDPPFIDRIVLGGDAARIHVEGAVVGRLESPGAVGRLMVREGAVLDAHVADLTVARLVAPRGLMMDQEQDWAGRITVGPEADGALLIQTQGMALTGLSAPGKTLRLIGSSKRWPGMGMSEPVVLGADLYGRDWELGAIQDIRLVGADVMLATLRTHLPVARDSIRARVQVFVLDGQRDLMGGDVLIRFLDSAARRVDMSASGGNLAVGLALTRGNIGQMSARVRSFRIGGKTVWAGGLLGIDPEDWEFLPMFVLEPLHPTMVVFAGLGQEQTQIGTLHGDLGINGVFAAGAEVFTPIDDEWLVTGMGAPVFPAQANPRSGEIVYIRPSYQGQVRLMRTLPHQRFSDPDRPVIVGTLHVSPMAGPPRLIGDRDAIADGRLEVFTAPPVR